MRSSRACARCDVGVRWACSGVFGGLGSVHAVRWDALGRRVPCESITGLVGARARWMRGVLGVVQRAWGVHGRALRACARVRVGCVAGR